MRVVAFRSCAVVRGRFTRRLLSMSPEASAGGVIKPKTKPGEKMEISDEGAPTMASATGAPAASASTGAPTASATTGAREPKSESGEKKEGWLIDWPTAATIIGIAGVGVAIWAQKSAEQAQQRAAEQEQRAAEQEAYDKSRAKQVDVAVALLAATFSAEKPKKLKGDYIPRGNAEMALRKYLGVKGAEGATEGATEAVEAAAGTEVDGYLVVTAPKGCGKSTVIHHVLAEGGRTGVVLVKVENKDTVPDIQKLVVQALGVSSGDPVGGDRLGFIKEINARYTKEHDGLLPTYVINIEGDRTNPEAVGSLAKQLGHFQKAISCDSDSDIGGAFSISDISAIALASGMAYDPRAKYVNIPGLTTEQALHLLKPHAQKLQQHGMLVKDIVDQIGGNPAWLIRVATDPNPQAVIDAEFHEALDQVKRCLHAQPEYREPLRQLVLKGYDDAERGMLAFEFNDIKDMGASSSWWPWGSKPSSEASDVINVSQKYRIVHKNLQSKHIVFHTYLHYRAAKQVLKC